MTVGRQKRLGKVIRAGEVDLFPRPGEEVVNVRLPKESSRVQLADERAAQLARTQVRGVCGGGGGCEGARVCARACEGARALPERARSEGHPWCVAWDRRLDDGVRRRGSLPYPSISMSISIATELLSRPNFYRDRACAWAVSLITAQAARLAFARSLASARSLPRSYLLAHSLAPGSQ